MSQSLALARGFLGQWVQVVIDRPLGSTHPNNEQLVYEVNYGYVPDTRAPDGDALDVYYLGADVPLDSAEGLCIAIIHRLDDDDDKLIVVPAGVNLSDAQIRQHTYFVEQWFTSEIIR